MKRKLQKAAKQKEKVKMSRLKNRGLRLKYKQIRIILYHQNVSKSIKKFSADLSRSPAETTLSKKKN